MQTKLTMTEKKYIMECIVLNYDCFLSIFYENVRYQDGSKALLEEKLEKAETEKDIRKIVNEYI